MLRFKKVIGTTLIFALLIMSMLANVAVASETTTCPEEIVNFAQNELGMSVTVLEKNEMEKYLALLHRYKDTKIRKNMLADNVRVMRVEPQKTIYITGTFKNDNNKAIYAVINGKTNEIQRIAITTLSETGQIRILTYNSDGFIEEVITTEEEINQQIELTKKEMLDFIDQYNSGTINPPGEVSALISIPTDWEYWVCKFGGSLACTMGCVIFIELPPVMLTCKWACSYFWGKGVCS